MMVEKNNNLGSFYYMYETIGCEESII